MVELEDIRGQVKNLIAFLTTLNEVLIEIQIIKFANLSLTSVKLLLKFC